MPSKDDPPGDLVSPSKPESSERIGGEDDKDNSLGEPTLSTSSPSTDTCSWKFVITHVRANDIAVDLGRIPAGFYVAVKAGSIEQRTKNKAIRACDRNVEWDDEVSLPPGLSSNIYLKVYASYEFSPMLGNGDTLRTFVLDIDRLFQHGEVTKPIEFSPPEGEPISPCSLLSITVERHNSTLGLPMHISNQQNDTSSLDMSSTLARITDEGHKYLRRYHKHKKTDDLNYSISCFERVLQAYPDTHNSHAAILCNLATARYVSCQEGVTPEFDVPIRLYREAFELRPLGHPDRPATLFHLARAIIFRFLKLGDESDAAEARALLAQVQSICSKDSYEFQFAGRMLQGCIPDATTIHALLAAELDESRYLLDHPVQELAMLNARAFAFLGRFEYHGRMDYINGSITTIEKVVGRTEKSDPEWPLRAISHGILVFRRFHQSNSMEDLEKSISVLDSVLRHGPNNHPDRPIGLISLWSTLLRRFDRLRRVADKDRLLSVLEEAVGLVANDHSNRAELLVQLGIAFLQLYKQFKDLSHLDRSISLMEGGAQSAPGDDSRSKVDHPADPFTGAFTRKETLKILLNNGVMEYARLMCLKEAFTLRFHYSGNHVDQDKSKAMKEQASKFSRGVLRIPGFFGLVGFVSAMLLFGDRPWDVTGLRRVTALLGGTAQTSNDHPAHKLMLAAFIQFSLQRYERLGQIADVDRLISVEDTMRRAFDHDPSKPKLLSVLAIFFLIRFSRLGDLADLDKATSIADEVVRLIPADDPERASYLKLLSSMGIIRFSRLGHITDLNGSIAMLEEALECVPDKAHQKTLVLTALSNALQLRSNYLHNAADLEKSILAGEEAVTFSGKEIPSPFQTLGTAYLARFKQLGDVTDLDKSTPLLEKALHLTPEGHNNRPSLLNVNGCSSKLRFQLQGSLPALYSAISYFSCAARSRTSGHPLQQFEAFKFWFQCAISLRDVSRSEGDKTLLEALECGIGLLPQLAWLGLPFKDRYARLREAATITRLAISLNVSLGQTTRAIEWLEQGRCVVWGQSLQLRTPLDELRHTRPDLANLFQSLSGELQRSSAIDSVHLPYLNEGIGKEEPVEQQAHRHRALAIERENVLANIQTLPGFEGTFSPKTFSKLQASAQLGPIIVLSVCADHGYALIVLADLDEPIVVLLPDINQQRAEHLLTTLQRLLSNDGRVVSRNGLDRAARLVRQGTPDFNHILSELWTRIAKQVLDALALPMTGEPARVFWCPTGPLSFLPIHAAGKYDIPGPGNKVSDFVVSSYIPTFSILLPEPGPITVSDNIRLLVVPQPHSDGQVQLSGAPAEIKYIRETVSRLSSSHVELHETDGNVDDVLHAMEQSDWVHFACHGIQDVANPTDSGLCLADGRRLRLSDIIRLSRPRGGLAFLSACQTATGAVELSEEVVHLSAGMLFAGYSSVIGTMWSIRDSVAPQLAKDVYEQLLRDGSKPDGREAARALHNAVERLRQSGVPFIAWVPFIHMGI